MPYTSNCRFRTVLKMSVLWSPSADTAAESLITVSRAVSPLPRRFSAAVLMNSPTALGPPGVVGCRESVSFSSCWRKSSHSIGTAVRSCGMVAPGSEFRAAGVCRDQLDGARSDKRRRQYRRLRIGGHRVLLVDREGDQRVTGLRFDLLDCSDGDAEDAHLVAGVEAVGVGEVRGVDVLADLLPPWRRHHRDARRRG